MYGRPMSSGRSTDHAPGGRLVGIRGHQISENYIEVRGWFV